MKREVTLDSWRGLMLIIMAADHLGGPFGALIYRQFGYISAAEGFVFLSGVMCGLVYGRNGRTNRRLMFGRLWRRAWTIYRYQLCVLFVLFGFVTLLSFADPRLAAYYYKSGLGVFLDHPAASLLASLLCLYRPYMIGILSLYILYVVAAPFILVAFIKGRTLLAFVISGGLWLFSQLGGSAALADLLPDKPYLDLGFFDPFAWQVLFVAGAYFGWRRCTGLDVLPGFNTSLFLGGLAVAALLLILRHVGPVLTPNDLWAAMSRPQLGWLRAVNTVAVILTIYGFARLRSMELKNAWLALLGRHSLQVFCFHVLVIYAGVPFLWRIQQQGAIADAAMIAIFLISLSIPALLHERYRAVTRPVAA